MEKNPKLKKLIVQVVSNQLRSNAPPETKQTFERLLSDGYSKDEAKELIAIVVSKHIFDIMKQQQFFNEAKYIDDLSRLPELPLE